MSKKIVVLLFIIIGLLQSCNTTEPPPQEEKPTLTLTLEDASSIEAWIKLTTNNLQLPATVNLEQDNTVTQDIILSNADTVIYIDSLLPKTTYLFQVSSIEHPVSSNQLQVTTMDTTSHNFTWQTFTFGEPSAGSSVLNDVAIIDENNIWAVGEIYMNDSLGQPDPLPYNAVHWDGNNWKVKRISVEYNGNIITPPLFGIFAYSSTDIWLSSGVPVHGDGTNWTQYHLFDMGILGQNDGYLTKIWGKSSDDLYYVGTLGTIAHYQNGSWSKIESGTTTNLNDVWGINDSSANNSLVLCTVSSRYELGDYKLLSISGNTANEYFNWPYTRLYGIWFNSPQNIYIVGSGAYVYKNNSLRTINLPTNYFLTRVKGNALNDIYISTSNAVIFHYNGIDWKEMSNGIYGKYEGMDLKGNTVVFVGYNIEGGIVGKAVVTIGKHYK